MSWNITRLNLAPRHDDATEGHNDIPDVELTYDRIYGSLRIAKEMIWKSGNSRLSTHTHERADVCFIFHASPTLCAEDKSHRLHPNILILFHRSLLRKSLFKFFPTEWEFIYLFYLFGVWQGTSQRVPCEGTLGGNNTDTDGRDHIWTETGVTTCNHGTKVPLFRGQYASNKVFVGLSGSIWNLRPTAFWNRQTLTPTSHSNWPKGIN